jgi:DNA-binding FadR family transcriptional regulator
MSPGVTFERVYFALKERLGSGNHAAGEQLEPAALASDLNSSITPVRDALHRLVGEGLVEAPRSDGFRTPFLTEAGLRHLYSWNAALLDLAARGPTGRPPDRADAQPEADPLARLEKLFLAVAAAPGNPEHMAAVSRLNERLRPVRRIELALPGVTDGEVEAMTAFLAQGDRRSLRRSIAAYHRRRARLAAEIVERLHAR